MNFFSPLPHRPVTLPPKEVDRRFTFLRYRQVAVMLVVYALFYVCRLAFSATKKTLIERRRYRSLTAPFPGNRLSLETIAKLPLLQPKGMGDIERKRPIA